MSPDPRRSSGEWPQGNPAPTFVTNDQFTLFAQECRESFTKINAGIDDVKKDLAQGSTRFALLERELAAQKTRTDDHSSKISTLLTDKTVRETKEAQAEEQAKPRRDIGFEIVKTLVLGVVLAFAAVIYNAWKDQEVSRALKEKEKDSAPTSSATTPSTPATGPVTIPR